MERPWFQLATRLGFAVRGLLYIVVAALVLTTGRSEDPAGALDYLGEGSGRLLLFAATVGLFAYGLWRLLDALLGFDHPGSDGKAKAKRAAAGFSGIVHLLLAWQAFKLSQGSRGASGEGAQQSAQAVLELPGGTILLGVLAAAIAASGVSQLVTAARCGFLKKLDLPPGGRDPIRWLGRIGYAARGVIFLVIALFLARSAISERSSEAGGMERALDWLSTPVETAVAAGLLLFGLFSLVEARFRRITSPPPVDAIAAKVAP